MDNEPSDRPEVHDPHGSQLRHKGLPRRSRSLRDPAGLAMAPLALGTSVLIAIALVWAMVRFDGLDSETQRLADSRPGSSNTGQSPAPGSGSGGQSDTDKDGSAGDADDGDNGDNGDKPEPFPTEEPSDPEDLPDPLRSSVIGVQDGLDFAPKTITLSLGRPIVVRNTSKRRCTMTATKDSDLVPAMLDGENNPVLQSAANKGGNHTVTFLSPDDTGTATLTCNYEVFAGDGSDSPTEEPSEEQSTPGSTPETTPGASTETPSDTGSSSASNEPSGETGQIRASKVLTIHWREE